ncbi:type II secretion system protein [Marinobacter sp. SS8-8]|uniref:type II secretion system protein n=1 Tax=Marinobacter sp. SS8-8 TaxID=3050452 RepID=UPI000C4200FD|nr:type II secretion system protein [Marinobacter sp. SS8-8]MAZ06379.1 prepilin-type cleavage/methylation domain-containing protein [Halomonas sp.]|tara:strand:- start:71701 stop:72477 length:777 start_codon:yes stop_codon:yes gene_type:complete
MLRRAGFTLIELLMVIVLLSIVATVSVRFVSLSTQGALDVSARQLRAFQGVVVSEQITRELREAFPLSVRTFGSCIEWLPLQAGTNYLQLTQGPGFDEIDIAAFDQVPAVGSTRAVVYGYGTSTADLYAGTSPGPVSPLISSINNTGSPARIELAGAHRFTATSPARRLFVVGEPVSLCQNGRFLYRYSGYAPTSAQQAPPSGNREILAANLTGAANFRFLPATLQRAAVVQFTFTLLSEDGAENTTVSQEVQIRNVP